MIFSTRTVYDDPDGKRFEAATADPSPYPLYGIDEADSAGIDWILISRGDRQVRLDTGNMKAAFNALNACSKDMLNYWGIDGKAHTLLTKRPEWLNQRSVANRIASDYPENASRSGEQAILRMRVIIDATGKVTDCKIRQVTVAESLKSPACKEMMRAEFSPAFDANGKAIPSYFQASILYNID